MRGCLTFLVEVSYYVSLLTHVGADITSGIAAATTSHNKNRKHLQVPLDIVCDSNQEPTPCGTHHILGGENAGD